MTKEEKMAIYAKLAAPFPEHCIQRTEGRITGRGYDTAFIYGGYGYFDNMNYFFGHNGYRVVDRTGVGCASRFWQTIRRVGDV